MPHPAQRQIETGCALVNVRQRQKREEHVLVHLAEGIVQRFVQIFNVRDDVAVRQHGRLSGRRSCRWCKMIVATSSATAAGHVAFVNSRVFAPDAFAGCFHCAKLARGQREAASEYSSGASITLRGAGQGNSSLMSQIFFELFRIGHKHQGRAAILQNAFDLHGWQVEKSGTLMTPIIWQARSAMAHSRCFRPEWRRRSPRSIQAPAGRRSSVARAARHRE
jgi:hypothetical protein